MKRKDPRCPQCGDNGKVNSERKCETCGEQLVYADGDGTLKAAEKERKCPRCGTANSKEVRFCESCGTEIGKFCGYCNTYHFIEDKVCPRTGEPVKGGGKEAAAVSALPKVLSLASVIAIIFFSFIAFKMSHRQNNQTVVPTPVYVVVQPTQVQVHPVTKPRIDVVFVVDSTGSMGDEIEVLKEKIKEMVRTIASGQPTPDVRYGLVAFRDRGDAFVTRKYEFASNIDDIVTNINQLAADGGGDTQESVNQALHEAIYDLNWDTSANTRKMIFLIGDAGPHMDYPGDFDYKADCAAAKNKGIKIFTLGCSGIENSGEQEYREIAQLTGGTFDFLTYQQVYTRSDGTEMKVVTAGKKAYVLKADVKDSEWKEGYSSLVTRGKAEEIDASTLRASEPASSIAGAPAAPGKAKCAPAPRPASELRNNADAMFQNAIKAEAESCGVKYNK